MLDNTIDQNINHTQSTKKEVSPAKRKKQRKPQSKKSHNERKKLITLSQEAKGRILIHASTTGEELGVNQMLIIMYTEQTGCTDYRTFHQWKDDGYQVKKGETAFRVWGTPIKAKDAEVHDKDDESGYQLFPMCCLFNKLQVEKMDRSLQTHDEQSSTTQHSSVSPASKGVHSSNETQITLQDDQMLESVETDPLPTAENNPFVTTHYDEQLDNRITRYEDIARRARDQSESTYKRAKSMQSAIPFGQPILVGHHSETRDRNYRNRIHKTYGKAFELDDKAKHYERKANSAGTSGVSSNDPNAIAKLQEELQSLIDNQETMKAANKAIRQGDDEQLKALDYTEKQIIAIKTPDCMNNIGFAQYALSNNNANIRRIRLRIQELEKLYKTEPIDFSNDEFSMMINDGRVAIPFVNGKPSEEIRKLLKSYSFKWSRYSTAWVRKVTANGLCASDQLLEQLKRYKTVY